jgi:AcrR family transcriptional regulator
VDRSVIFGNEKILMTYITNSDFRCVLIDIPKKIPKKLFAARRSKVYRSVNKELEMSQNKRPELIRKALLLFYRNGFHATGMDLVAKETGVSKTSIYKHFRTKEELILAVLRLRDENFRNWFYRRMEELAGTPGEQLLVLFDALEEWFLEDNFKGCMFIKASAEFQEQDHAINAQAFAHKQMLGDHLTGLAKQAGYADPRGLACQLLILKEGAIVLAAMSHSAASAKDARAAAAILLRAADRES